LTGDGSSTDSKFQLNDKFHIFLAGGGERLVRTVAELDAGIVGHKSIFGGLVESCFNEGFPAGGVDGMTFTDIAVSYASPLSPK
jgi:hypothetical protein